MKNDTNHSFNPTALLVCGLFPFIFALLMAILAMFNGNCALYATACSNPEYYGLQSAFLMIAALFITYWPFFVLGLMVIIFAQVILRRRKNALIRERALHKEN